MKNSTNEVCTGGRECGTAGLCVPTGVASDGWLKERSYRRKAPRKPVPYAGGETKT
nr:hypothetical protein [Candidatus Freyarchaeota archaeon]